MPNGGFLEKALLAVKWDQNVADFLSSATVVARFEDCGRGIALWAKQLETADKGNTAIPFIRDMQVSAQHVAAVTALALYRPAAYGMRCVLEACFYYSFFRVHPAELRTLAVDSDYYLTKDEVIAFHKKHTRGYKERQERTGLQNSLNACYKKVSALAHGQVPGGWVGHTALSQVKHHDKMLLSVADTFEEVERVVRLFLLCTVAQDLWTAFSLPARREFLKGLSGETKTAVGLSALYDVGLLGARRRGPKRLRNRMAFPGLETWETWGRFLMALGGFPGADFRDFREQYHLLPDTALGRR